MVYPDLTDQELANNLMLAEKVQKGRMTLIEMKAVKAQLHSQIVTEFQRRQLAKMAAAPSRPAAPSANLTGLADRPAPVVQANPEQIAAAEKLALDERKCGDPLASCVL